MVKGLTSKYKQLAHHGVLISITDYRWYQSKVQVVIMRPVNPMVKWISTLWTVELCTGKMGDLKMGKQFF